MDDGGGDPEEREGQDRPSHPPGTAPLPGWWWRLDVRWRRVIFGAVVIVVLVAGALVIRAVFGGGGDGIIRTEAEIFVDQLPPDRVALWDSLAECESEGDWTLINDPFYGGLQFTIESWQAVGGLGRADQVPREEQIMRAEMLYDEQGWNAWPNCSGQLGLR